MPIFVIIGLCILGYLILGIFIHAIARELEKDYTNSSNWIILGWPLVAFVYIVIGIIVLLPDFLGGCIGKGLRRISDSSNHRNRIKITNRHEE